MEGIILINNISIERYENQIKIYNHKKVMQVLVGFVSPHFHKFLNDS